jgi:hypothetical protein
MQTISYQSKGPGSSDAQTPSTAALGSSKNWIAICIAQLISPSTLEGARKMPWLRPLKRKNWLLLRVSAAVWP